MPRALCFIDMPFGRKPDLASGTEIDFDRVHELAIKPAVEAVGLESLRGDEEQGGGIIHVAMFARLLMAEYVIADLTLANPNVFYELGIRHAAKPFTTVPLFATTHALPFDVGLIRAVPYRLEDGVLSDAEAARLREAIEQRLRQAIDGPRTNDSPLFQLLPEFPGIELAHEIADAFQDRVRDESDFSARLKEARRAGSDAERVAALRTIEQSLGELKTVQRNVLVELMLAYRAVGGWNEIVALFDRMSNDLQSVPLVCQQTALALNRRHAEGDRARAVAMLEGLIDARGPDPETLGILGRIHKDRYREAKAAGEIMASAHLDDAIDTYRRGFEADPRDYFPGVNAVTLLVEKGDETAMLEVERLLPLVRFAVARRGGERSSDYWDLATTLELACIARDWRAAIGVLPRVIAHADESWKLRTTRENLLLLDSALGRGGASREELTGIIAELQKRETALAGG